MAVNLSARQSDLCSPTSVAVEQGQGHFKWSAGAAQFQRLGRLHFTGRTEERNGLGAFAFVRSG